MEACCSREDEQETDMARGEGENQVSAVEAKNSNPENGIKAALCLEVIIFLSFHLQSLSFKLSTHSLNTHTGLHQTPVLSNRHNLSAPHKLFNTKHKRSTIITRPRHHVENNEWILPNDTLSRRRRRIRHYSLRDQKR